ncbi:EF-hand calcium-binding domain-containing protein 5 isoform X1 [Podarcis raffonei]|uniref:EF-hand calcium-binding domain-containing protein 5 isoform X1 n=1 Tax=Podarcis raffonei TaxID=65483 RepID=UPI0023293875|nr:EF-hand calcium-binding domain-containing protein 5 isoform X1 [Podarcis raffonei]XP_053222516.1 EF-hand calcium-binding domain-containing protein 5 isoform X1 [Podarcis raffonei]XP_053222517.1 EF-hand calcium-binding domain-containing protein 5 isoform X1 [Podarcis raffonei]
MDIEAEKSEAGSERSPVSETHLEEATSSPSGAVRPLTPRTDAQWKSIFYETLQPRALDLQQMRVEKLRNSKMVQKKAEKKEPPDKLSRDWFNDESMTLETRAYLVDKLLPTLVPGVEKLLMAAEKKKALERKESEPLTFDPITFLGEYLMRHNPAYEISAMPNPYVRGLKAVADELKTKVPETTLHKLEQMKTLVKEKRKQREQVEKIKTHVRDMRKQALSMQFKEWTMDLTGQIPVLLIQSALKSFMESVSSELSDDGTGIYARPLESVGSLAPKLNEEQFTEYLHSYIKNFSSDMFQQLLQHLLQCANDARNIIRHDIWRQMFLQLFFNCDHGKVGLLDRQRILSLLEVFFYNCSPQHKKGFLDPKKWPIIELDDIEVAEFWGNMEDEQISERSSLNIPTGELGLSEESIALKLLLKDILSDMEMTAPEEAPEGSAAADQEKAGVEQEASHAGEEGEVLLATALQDQAEMPAVEPGSGEAAVQEEQDPAAPAAAESAAQETVVPTGKDVVPVTTRVSEPVLPVETLEADRNPQPRSSAPASLFNMQSGLQQTQNKELGPGQEAGLEGQGAAAEQSSAETAAAQEEPGKEPEPGSRGQLHRSSEGVPGPSKRPGQKLSVSDLLSMPSGLDSETCEKAPQKIYGKIWSGNLQTADLSFVYTDYGKEIREDWNNESTRFPDLRMNMIEIQARGPPSTISSFDKESLNLPQFVQLMETFVGEETTLSNVKRLVEFVKEGYVQTEKEKIRQMERIHQNSFLVRQQLLLAALFEKWDNECSGFLDMQEVDAVLSTFKEGMEQEALNKAKLQLPIPQWHPSGIVKLSQRDFQTYMELVVSELTGDEDELLDNIVEFLMMAVERTHTERLRGSARRKWLLKMEHAAVTNGGCIKPVYDLLFKVLCRDTDAHGDTKKISAYIALLEYNLVSPERGDVLLHYVACTEDDAPYVLNQSLFMDMEGVSFAAALDDKPIHVPRVQLHGNIHFWNQDRPLEERKGSFLVLPLEDIRRRVFGVLGLDTLQDKNEKTIFVPHEIRFYQGIANTFSIAYHHIRTKESIMQVIITALGWLFTRVSLLQTITTYFMEPGEDRMHDYTLRKVMTADQNEPLEVHLPPGPVVRRRDNIFRDYLFKCIDCSVVVTTFVFEEHRIAVPLRNQMGQAIAVFDVNFGSRQKLPTCEHRDLQKMLRTIQAAVCEILKEDSGEKDPFYVLEAEYVGDWRRGGVLFYRFMLQELQNCIWNLDPFSSFSEIRCFEKPPSLVHTILKCALLILYPQWAGTQEVEDWNCCIEKIDGELIENICYFDPTAAYVEVRPETLYNCLHGAHRKAVWKFRSAPMEYLYNWVNTCLSLIELAKKLQHHQSMATSSTALITPTLSRSLRSSQISANTNYTFAIPLV